MPTPSDTKSSLAVMLASKKFRALISGLVLVVLAKFGLDADQQFQDTIAELIMVYIGAQGIADAGQGFAHVMNARSTTSGSPNTPPPGEPT